MEREQMAEEGEVSEEAREEAAKTAEIIRRQEQAIKQLFQQEPGLVERYGQDPGLKRSIDDYIFGQVETVVEMESKRQKKEKDLEERAQEIVKIPGALGPIESEWPVSDEGKIDFMRAALVKLYNSGDAEGGPGVKEQLSQIGMVINAFRMDKRESRHELGERMYREFIAHMIINGTFVEYRKAQDRKTAVGYASSLNTDLLNFSTKDSSVIEGRPITESIALCHKYSEEIITRGNKDITLDDFNSMMTEELKVILSRDPKRQADLQKELVGAGEDEDKRKGIREKHQARLHNDAKLAQMAGERIWRLLGRRSFGDYMSDAGINSSVGFNVEFQIRGRYVYENGKFVYKNRVVLSEGTEMELDTRLEEHLLRENRNLTDEQKRTLKGAQRKEICDKVLKDAKEPSFINNASAYLGDTQMRNADQQFFWTRKTADKLNLELLDSIDLEGMCAFSIVPGKLESSFSDKLSEYYQHQQSIDVEDAGLKIAYVNGELIVNGQKEGLQGLISGLSKDKKLSAFWQKALLDDKGEVKSAESVRVAIASRKAAKGALVLTEALVGKENGYTVTDGNVEEKHYWHRNNEFDISRIKWKGLTVADVQGEEQLKDAILVLNEIYKQSHRGSNAPEIQKLTEIDFTIFSQNSPLGYWGYRNVSSPDGAREALTPFLQDALNQKAQEGVLEAFNYKQDKKWSTLAQVGLNLGEFYKDSPVARELGYRKPTVAELEGFLYAVGRQFNLKPTETRDIINEIIGRGLGTELVLFASQFRVGSALGIFFWEIIKGILQQGISGMGK